MGIKTVQDTSLTSVANAIRVKAEISGTLEFPDEFVSAIQNISTGITPSGTKTITQNGTYDVTDYASADVNVSGGGGGGDAVVRSLVERSIRELVIPDGTTKIGDYAFRDCTSLASITIPSSVTSIGFYAFYGCIKLTSVAIPNGVKSIPSSSFRGCTSLASITIPSSVTSIDTYAFYGCSALSSITCEAVTPPALASSAIDRVPLDCSIYVPSASVEAYKSASTWDNRADYIQAIPE